ncbi:MAG: hypothetical protein IJ723_05490 [Ruminococcus sp.]|nr:hypothetical protein [Ruminococcus sp.]
MKARVSVIAVCLAAALFCGCSSKAAEKPEKISETAAAETTAPEVTLPADRDSFEKLPEGEEDELVSVSDAAHSAFPDAKGKKMFGFKGTEQLELDGTTADCYIFDYYTYKSKTYTKIATLAKNVADGSVFMLDDATGKYLPCTPATDNAAVE